MVDLRDPRDHLLQAMSQGPAPSTLPAYIRRVVSYAPGKVALLVGLMTLAGLCEGLSFTLFIPLIRAISGSTVDAHELGALEKVVASITGEMSFGGLLLFILAIFVAKNVLIYLQKTYSASLSLSFERHIKKRIIETFLASDWRFYLREKVGTILNAIGSQSKNSADAFRIFTLLCLELLNVSVYCVLGLALSPQAFALSLAAGAATFLILRNVVGRSRIIGTEVVHIKNECLSRVLEDYTGIKFIKGNRLEEERKRGLFADLDRLMKVEMKGERFAATMDTLPDFIMAAVVCLILYVAKERIAVTGESLLVLIMVLYRMNRRLIALQGLRQRLHLYLPSFDLCRQLVERAEQMREATGSKPIERMKHALTFDSVDFSYDEQPVLRGLSLDVPLRKFTALVGRSGSGKTTVVDLALGLLKPSAGNVRIDGLDLREYDLSAWRERIGYVPQEALLVNGSIEDNIRLGRPAATREEVLEAARLAHAHEFIEKQPQGYATLVGDRGAKLSGGQRQRIALARALVRKPELLVLDEATSALDQESERMVQQAIEGLKGRLTILLVAHRLSTVERADSIYVLDGGRVAQSGRLEELKMEQGVFRQLYGTA